MKQDRFILVISSPSGAGKTTICYQLLQEDPALLMSISATTRPKSDQEINGKDYFFLSRGQFLKTLKSGGFLEHTEIYGNLYGTPKKFVMEAMANHHDILFDVNWDGAQSIKVQMHEHVVSIFILPPSIEELASRLRNRKRDNNHDISVRLEESRKEMRKYSNYDYVVINDDLTKCVRTIQAIIEVERLKRINIDSFAKNICNS